MNVKLILGLVGIAVIIGMFFAGDVFNNDKDNVATINTGLEGDISIGTLLPITGDLSSQGEEDKLAVEMAANDFNDYLKKNNFNWNLKIINEDSGTHPDIALEKLTSLNAQDIHLIVGPASSSELRNIMDYANTNKMLIFSPSSTAPSLAIPNDGVYRLTPDDSKQGPAIATLLESKEIHTIIQLVRADTWGDGLSASIAKSFEEKGGIIAQTIKYDPESPEFSATTSQLAQTLEDQLSINSAENVGIIVIGFSETLQFMQSASELDILDDVLWFGTDAITNEEKIINDSIASKFANKVQFTSTLTSTIENDIRNDVEERLFQQIGRTPNTYAFSSYDIVWILGLAILEANSSDVDSLTPIISDIASNYNGAVGNAKLNEAGDLDTSNYDVWMIQNGEWNIVGLYDSSKDTILEKTHEISIESEKRLIEKLVNDSVQFYDEIGIDAFKQIDTNPKYRHGNLYVFVLDEQGFRVAHGGNPDLVGIQVPNDVDNPIRDIILENATIEGTWITYDRALPNSDIVQVKHSFIVEYDNLIFGAGYYEQ